MPGTYGLQLSGDRAIAAALAVARRWVPPAPACWPHWRIEWKRARSRGWSAPEGRGGADAGGPDPGGPGGGSECRRAPGRRLPAEVLLPDRAHLRASVAGGWIELDRASQRTRLAMPEPVTAAALVHPYLASTAAIAAHWFGRTPFHAGGFALDGQAWGVLGGREMGKSSLLMGLHVAGVPVVSDDLVVLDEGKVYAGPRCLDLRRGAAERFAAGEPLGQVGRRDRWRVDLPHVPGALPLAGWVVLGWSEEVVVGTVRAGQALAALATNRAVTAQGEAPRALLDAASLPMVLFSRPRDWSRLQQGLDRLVHALAGRLVRSP